MIKKLRTNKESLGIVVAICAAVILGFWPTSIRGIYREGGNFVFAILLMSWARGVGLGAFCLIKGKKLFATRTQVKEAIVSGFFQAVATISLFKALETLPGPLVIIIMFSHTIMLLFYMAWRKEVTLDLTTIAITLLALFGLSLVLDVWSKQDPLDPIGIIYAFTAAFMTVGRVYVWGQQTKTIDAAVVGAECYIMTSLFSLIVLVTGMPQLPITMLGGLYTLAGIVVLVGGGFLIFYGISLLGSFRWSLFAKLEPVFTSIYAALFLGEILRPLQYFGVAVVLSSLAGYQIVSRREKIKPVKISS